MNFMWRVVPSFSDPVMTQIPNAYLTKHGGNLGIEQHTLYIFRYGNALSFYAVYILCLNGTCSLIRSHSLVAKNQKDKI